MRYVIDPSLFWVKKEKESQKEEKLAEQATKPPNPPPLPPPSCLDPPLKKVLLLPLRKVLLLNTILVFALVISQEPLVTPSLTIMARHLLLRMKTTISIPM